MDEAGHHCPAPPDPWPDPDGGTAALVPPPEEESFCLRETFQSERNCQLLRLQSWSDSYGSFKAEWCCAHRVVCRASLAAAVWRHLGCSCATAHTWQLWQQLCAHTQQYLTVPYSNCTFKMSNLRKIPQGYIFYYINETHGYQSEVLHKTCGWNFFKSNPVLSVYFHFDSHKLPAKPDSALSVTSKSQKSSWVISAITSHTIHVKSCAWNIHSPSLPKRNILPFLNIICSHFSWTSVTCDGVHGLTAAGWQPGQCRPSGLEVHVSASAGARHATPWVLDAAYVADTPNRLVLGGR